MSERGFFAVDRGIWDHPLFDDGKPFSRREAWLWMISEAAWKGRFVRTPGLTRELDRGQIAHSVRFMAKAWNWEQTKVVRWIDRCKTETMITTDTATGQTIITICNYDKHQRDAKAYATEVTTDLATEPQRDRNATATNKKKEITKEGNKEGRDAPHGAPPSPSESGKREKASKLPEDWAPKDGHYAEAAAAGLGRSWVDGIATNMRLWATANDKRSITTKSDWDAAFRGAWLRKAISEHQARQQRGGAKVVSFVKPQFDPRSLKPEDWLQVLDMWCRLSRWNPDHGPEPGREGCFVPAAVLDRWRTQNAGQSAMA